MKTIIKLTLLILALLLPVVVSAHDFEVNGIYYNKNGSKATVTYRGSSYNEYSDRYVGNVTIPSTVTYNGTIYSVTSIGNNAFFNCNELSNVNIPNSVTSINYSAFSYCTGLTDITIPNSVTSIDYYAFSYCTSLTRIYISDLTAWCQISFGDASANPLSFAQHLFLNDQEIQHLVIPNTITSISRYAFYGFNSLTNLTIPNTITSIGEYTFSNCTNLANVTIPNSVTSIGKNAFGGCSSLTELNFNAISCADFYTYNGESYSPFCNTFIATIKVGENVQKIPANFVKGLTTLRTVILGNSITTIGNSAFYGCNCMTDVSFGESVSIVDNNAFYGCSGLKHLSFSNSLTTIGSNAFYGCSGLIDLVLPSTVQTLRSKAFYNCSGLKSVYSYAETPPVMESSDCYNCYNTATLYVPYEVLDTYKNTYYWNSFYRIYGVDENGNILVTGLSLNVTNKNLNVNQSFRLVATVTPDYATNKTINWTSSNPSVASVDSTGLVTALSAGTATITATTTDGSNLSASCDVTVSIIPVTSLSLNKTSLTLDVDDTHQLSATISPSNATYKTLTWTSSNPAVATVSDNGLVTPVSPGEATITATTTDGTNLSASCQVTVIKRIKSITLNESNMTLTLPQTTQLIAFITPSDATNQDLTWTSSNTSVATVDANGFVTSKAVGTTTIKATTKDGSNLSASCQVTVVKQYVTSITLNEPSLVMHIGDTFQLIADVQPDNASNPALSWSTGNSSVARVDNNGLVTAMAGGNTYIRASATDGSNTYANCTIEVLPDYYLTLDTLSHIRGSLAQIQDLPVSLVNKNPISGIQFDISLPSGVEFNMIDGLPDVWLDEDRATRTHSISASQLSNGKYRILVTSSASKDLRGNDGVLVHMNMLLPQQHDTGNRYINITNIIASESDETRHTLDNKSTMVHFYYIVGDADANAVVDIADHAATASKILGKSPSPFYYDAANVDNNSSLDVVDLVGITNIALEIKPITIRQAPRRGGIENRLFCDKLHLYSGGEKEISIGIDCSFDFAGFQMDMKLPHGLTLMGATLSDEASKLSLATQAMPDGTIRILGTSFSDASVNGVCPQLLTLRVRAENNYHSGSQIEFSDILFAERDLTAHCFDSSVIEYIEPSTIYELMDEARIYIENGNIIVDTPIAGTVQLIAVDGRMIEYQAHVGHNVYPIDVSGVYIIHFLNKTIKVLL